MTFGNVRTVEELIDALSHFEGDTEVYVSHNFDNYHLGSIEPSQKNDYDVTPIVSISLWSEQ